MSHANETPLQTRDLTRRFGDDIAVDRLDLDVQRGEIHAVVGLNGAGKTTLMRLLLGMLKPDSGKALVNGFEAASAPGAVWARVGHLIETPFAYPELTVRENLTAAALLHGLDGEIASTIEETTDLFGLGRWSDRRAGHLSQGNRQRLGIASATVHDPFILILDEPANALDPAGVVFMRGFLERCASRGSAVLVSSHHLDELARIADRITVLHRGRHVGDLDPAGVDLEKRFFDLVYQADLGVQERAG